MLIIDKSTCGLGLPTPWTGACTCNQPMLTTTAQDCAVHGLKKHSFSQFRRGATNYRKPLYLNEIEVSKVIRYVLTPFLQATHVQFSPAWHSNLAKTNEAMNKFRMDYEANPDIPAAESLPKMVSHEFYDHVIDHADDYSTCPDERTVNENCIIHGTIQNAKDIRHYAMTVKNLIVMPCKGIGNLFQCCGKQSSTSRIRWGVRDVC